MNKRQTMTASIRSLASRLWRRVTNSSGMTMMEVMVAVLILTIALLGLLSMGVTALDSNSWSNDSTRTTQLVQERLEKLRTSATPESGSETTADGIEMEWKVTSEGAHLVRADVKATWTNFKNEIKTNELTSFIMTDSL